MKTASCIDAVRQLASGALYFYVGAGLSQASGLAGWNEVVTAVHRYRAQYEGWEGPPPESLTGDENSAYLQSFVSETSSGRRILSAQSTDVRTFGRTVLLNLLFRHDTATKAPTQRLELQKQLWQCKAHGVLTTNYDTLIERACPPELSGELRVYRYTAAFLPFLLSNPRFVLKLHGDVNDLGTIALDPESAWKARGVFGSRTRNWLKRLYATMAASGHIVFLGVGFRDRTIRELESSLQEMKTPSGFRRVALIPRTDLEGPSELSQARSDGHFRDVLFVPYESDPTVAYSEFLRQLADARALSALARPVCDEAIDISLNVFLHPPFPRRKRWKTTPWTMKSSRSS